MIIFFILLIVKTEIINYDEFELYSTSNSVKHELKINDEILYNEKIYKISNFTLLTSINRYDSVIVYNTTEYINKTFSYTIQNSSSDNLTLRTDEYCYVCDIQTEETNKNYGNCPSAKTLSRVNISYCFRNATKYPLQITHHHEGYEKTTSSSHRTLQIVKGYNIELDKLFNITLYYKIGEEPFEGVKWNNFLVTNYLEAFDLVEYKRDYYYFNPVVKPRKGISYNPDQINIYISLSESSSDSSSLSSSNSVSSSLSDSNSSSSSVESDMCASKLIRFSLSIIIFLSLIYLIKLLFAN